MSKVWEEFGIPERCVAEAVAEGDGTPALLFCYQGDPVFVIQPGKVELLKQRLAETGEFTQLGHLNRIIRNARRSNKRQRRQSSIGDETKPIARPTFK